MKPAAPLSLILGLALTAALAGCVSAPADSPASSASTEGSAAAGAATPGGPVQETGGETGSDHEGHDHGPTSTRRFADVDRWRQVFDDPSRAAWQKPERIPAVLGLEAGMTVADLGAGTGYFERFFSEAVGPGGRVLAVDVEPNMVEHMKWRARQEKTPNVEPILAAPDDPGLPPGQVDVIFICDTWHHIGNRIAYLDLLRRALAPDGVVAVVDFVKRDIPVGPAADHKIPKEAVIAEFSEAGWELVQESDLLPYQYFLIFRPRAERDVKTDPGAPVRRPEGR